MNIVLNPASYVLMFLAFCFLMLVLCVAHTRKPLIAEAIFKLWFFCNACVLSIMVCLMLANVVFDLVYCLLITGVIWLISNWLDTLLAYDALYNVRHRTSLYHEYENKGLYQKADSAMLDLYFDGNMIGKFHVISALIFTIGRMLGE